MIRQLSQDERKKWKKRLMIALVVTILLGGLAFWACHPTHYRYNDRFILGNTMQAVKNRYGEFDEVVQDTHGRVIRGAYYLEPEALCYPMLTKSYVISFNVDGRAYWVEIPKGRWQP